MNQISQNCSLSLDPNVFIFKGSSEFVLYNSELKTIVRIEKSDIINKIFNEFLNINNLYTVVLSDNMLNDTTVKDLILELQKNYMGDIFYDAEVKPITIPPVMKCHEALNGNMDNGNLLSLLNELTFYLIGDCDRNCCGCESYYKQFVFCRKNSGYLNVLYIKNLIERVIKVVPSLRINVCGGNIFKYPDLDELLSYFAVNGLKVNFYINNFNINIGSKILQKILLDNFVIHVLVNFPIIEDIFFNIVSMLRNVSNRVVYKFILTSENDIMELESVIKKFSIVDYIMVPFYNGSNISFFEKYVYITIDDLMSENLTKKDIFRRMAVNVNYVGRLIVSSDGNVYSNLNFSPLGNIKSDALPYLVEKEWKEGKAWKKVRNDVPCSNCAFKYLCPSPSDYELAINKPNLCHVF